MSYTFFWTLVPLLLPSFVLNILFSSKQTSGFEKNILFPSEQFYFPYFFYLILIFSQGLQLTSQFIAVWFRLIPHLIVYKSWVVVVHTCNARYLGGRDQKNCGLKPAQANSSWDPILKIPNTKQDWWSGSSSKVPIKQGWSPEFNP
jgi:hypothetical protein